ncbi:YkgJ family cysteine cluster protein [Vibrio sp. qd031]|uniref:YkgJ family cysteine cluster protein n=1 Tax=Vibrio sp. qd031 TaxID=1603038 RepID=UPI000A100F31|nr:YkgJ family cysteine cluster protein [Vibrio sp. qd031]
MNCRLGCGACCIAPSISSPIPGMPSGKPANTRCIQLNDDNLCRLFGLDSRPKVCLDFAPDVYICGDSDPQAMNNLIYLEKVT